MTFADPIDDDAIQYRGTIIQVLRLAMVPVLCELAPENASLKPETRWSPYAETVKSEEKIHSPKPKNQPQIGYDVRPTASRPSYSPPFLPSRFSERILAIGLPNPNAPVREYITLSENSKPLHLRVIRGSREISYVPMDRGTQIIIRLKKLGMTRKSTGWWIGGSGRLRELRFFSISQFPSLLKFQTYLR